MVLGPVPVMVTLYPTVVVVLRVVTVAVAVAGTVTDDGLTVQTGVSVVCCDDVTWQLRLTVPVNPLTDPTWIEEEDVPPGAIASGLNDAACRVNSDVPCWACAIQTERQANANAAAIRQTDILIRCELLDFTLDSNHSGLNMHEFGFKWLRFLGLQKSCPHRRMKSCANRYLFQACDGLPNCLKTLSLNTNIRSAGFSARDNRSEREAPDSARILLYLRSLPRNPAQKSQRIERKCPEIFSALSVDFLCALCGPCFTASSPKGPMRERKALVRGKEKLCEGKKSPARWKYSDCYKARAASGAGAPLTSAFESGRTRVLLVQTNR